MEILRAYKTELEPNNVQRTALLKHAGAARFAWNWGLARRKQEYEETGQSSNAIEQHRQLNALKKTDFSWLYEVSKAAPQEALRDLDKAYQNFFRRVKNGEKPGFPKFKSRKNGIGSFRLTGTIYVTNTHIKLPRIGWLRLKEHGYIPTDGIHILSVTVSETFRELDFRLRSWSSSSDLQELSELLRALKDQIKVLHKRDYLSITPKVEDLALVNRWIQHFNVRHFYLQVFFDKAYVIPFRGILEIASDSSKEDVVFSVERDIKNQGKTTIKINVQVGKEILGRIDMPEHRSAMKELDRGRLLFYVTFQNGRGYLDNNVFTTEIIHGT